MWATGITVWSLGAIASICDCSTGLPLSHPQQHRSKRALSWPLPLFRGLQQKQAAAPPGLYLSLTHAGQGGPAGQGFKGEGCRRYLKVRLHRLAMWSSGSLPCVFFVLGFFCIVLFKSKWKSDIFLLLQWGHWKIYWLWPISLGVLLANETQAPFMYLPGGLNPSSNSLTCWDFSAFARRFCRKKKNQEIVLFQTW